MRVLQRGWHRRSVGIVGAAVALTVLGGAVAWAATGRPVSQPVSASTSVQVPAAAKESVLGSAAADESAVTRPDVVPAATATPAGQRPPSPTNGLVVSAGPLVLSYNGTRYLGSMQVTARNNGSTVLSDLGLTAVVPAGLDPLNGSGISGCVGGLDQLWCGVNAIQPHTTATMTLNFGSSAAPADVARVTATGSVTVASSSSQNPPGRQEISNFAGVLASTSGSVSHPRPYRPSTVNDLAVSAGTASVTSNADGSLRVSLPVTVVDRTDAANTSAEVYVGIPPGSVFMGTNPAQPCGATTCQVPGNYWMSSGESRTFDVLFTMPAGTAPGDYQVDLVTWLEPNGSMDQAGADSRTTVTVTIAG
jgi:hypothetical protein